MPVILSVMICDSRVRQGYTRAMLSLLRLTKACPAESTSTLGTAVGSIAVN